MGCLVQFGDTPFEAVTRLFENVRIKHVGETDLTKKRQRAHVDRGLEFEICLTFDAVSCKKHVGTGLSRC